MRRITRLVAAGAAATLLLPLAVHASPRRDPDDAAGPLDVRRAAKVFLRRPLWRVDTYSPWRARRMQDRGYVLVYIDSFGDERADYYVVVRAAAGRLHGLLFRDRPGPRRDRSIGHVNVWRATRRSLAFRVRLTKIYVGSRRRVLRWYVQTVFTSGTCRRVCFDRVPNSGMVEDDLPKPPDGG